MHVLLGTLDGETPLPVMLQVWGEATVNPDLHDVLTGQLDAMRTAMEHALQRWAHQQVDGGQELAARVAKTCIIMCQGFLANRCLFGWADGRGVSRHSDSCAYPELTSLPRNPTRIETPSRKL
jgi:hypothetical protein